MGAHRTLPSFLPAIMQMRRAGWIRVCACCESGARVSRKTHPLCANHSRLAECRCDERARRFSPRAWNCTFLECAAAANEDRASAADGSLFKSPPFFDSFIFTRYEIHMSLYL